MHQYERFLSTLISIMLNKFNYVENFMCEYFFLDWSKVTGRNCKSLQMFRLKQLSFVKISVFLLILVFVKMETVSAQAGAMSFYKASSSGNDKLNINNREYALLSIAYYEKKMNHLYESFWRDYSFKTPRDMFVRIMESTLHEDGLVLVFDVAPKVAEQDTGFVKHQRFSDMLAGYLTDKMIKTDSAHKWIRWMTGINENYGPAKKKDTLSSGIYKSAFRYIDPPGGDISTLDKPKGKARGRRRISVREYAMLYLTPMLDDIRPEFEAFLQLNALRMFENAELKMEPNKFDPDVISIVFRIDNLGRINDPGYAQLRHLTQTLLPFVERKIKPIKNEWLKIRFEVEPIESPRDRTVLGETVIEQPQLAPTDSTSTNTSVHTPNSNKK